MNRVKKLISIFVVMMVVLASTALVQAAAFVLKDTKLELEVGESKTINVEFYGERIPLSATLKQTHIANMDEHFVVTGLADGVAEVVFYTQGGKDLQSCKIIVGTGESSSYSMLIMIVQIVLIVLMIIAVVIINRKVYRYKLKKEKELEEHEVWE